MKTVPDHEKLFENCGKLNELSQKPEYRGDIMASNWNERIEKMQMQLKIRKTFCNLKMILKKN